MFSFKVVAILRKKIKFVIIISVFCALCAAGYKYLFSPDTIIQGEFIYTKVIRIENGGGQINPKKPLNYLGIMNSNGNFQKFIVNTDNKIFNYLKINSSWNRIIQQDKISWLRGRILFGAFNENVFEITFVVPASNISDIAYLVNNASMFMDAFVLNAQDSIREIDPDVSIKTIKSYVITPERFENGKRNIVIKNAIYGFIAGLFLSSCVFIGIPLYRYSQL